MADPTPATKDLVSLTRCKASMSYIVDTSFDTVIASLITSASDAIAKYCRRDFYSRTYDELYNGNGDRRLLLREYPIQSINWVRYRPVTVMTVINKNQAVNQQARITITSTGLTLQRVASGTSTTNTLLFAT